jgi:predicted aspartyl protease
MTASRVAMDEAFHGPVEKAVRVGEDVRHLHSSKTANGANKAAVIAPCKKIARIIP